MSRSVSDWIQIRLDLQHDPKLARMLDILRKSIGSYVLRVSPDDLLSGVTSGVTCPVTDLVTSAALRDIVLAALIRVWGAANSFVRDETIPGITPDWVDDISGIPGFGCAMAKVGWIEATPDSGLRFPNFEQYNRPKTNILRSNGAIRKERQRLRQWLAENHAGHPDFTAKKSRLATIESRVTGRDMSRDINRDCPVTGTPHRTEQDSILRQLQQPSAQEPSAASPTPSTPNLGRGIDLTEARVWADGYNRSNPEGVSIPMPIITAWHDDRQASGWTTVRDGTEFPIRDWQADLRRYARKWQQNERNPRPTKVGSQRTGKPIILTTKPVNGF